MCALFQCVAPPSDTNVTFPPSPLPHSGYSEVNADKCLVIHTHDFIISKIWGGGGGAPMASPLLYESPGITVEVRMKKLLYDY